MPWILVALGGALGSLLRYALQGRFLLAFPGPFPAGTLAVNLTGSLFVGILGALFMSLPVSVAMAANLRALLVVGILGGFTTFSSFSLENLILLRVGQWRLALLYVLSTNILGIALALGGFFACRALMRPS